MQQERPTRRTGRDPTPPRAGSALGARANGPLRAVGEATTRNRSVLCDKRGVAFHCRGPASPGGNVDKVCRGPGVRISYGMASRSAESSGTP